MLSSRTLAVVIGIVSVAAITGAVVARRSTGPELEVFNAKPETSERAGLCPWRSPEADLKRYFPGATGYKTELLVLSHKRQQILRRLGPGHELTSYTLYIYPVTSGTGKAGTVCVRRAPGRFGAIEVVLALDPNRRVLGVHIQRQREPKATAELLAGGKWLDAFAGKDVESPFTIGRDLPDVPADCRQSAAAVADAVRSILIELDEGAPASPTHH